MQDGCGKLCHSLKRHFNSWNGGYSVATKSVAKALDILEVVCSSGAALDLHEIGDTLDLPNPTVYRLLQTLLEHGYVRQDRETRKYSPGLMIFELSQSVIATLQFTEVAREPLRRLANETRETVHLAVLDQAEVIYLQKHESTYPMALYSRVGRRAPAHCTGVGKLLLAHLSETERAAVLQHTEPQAFTANTITDREALEEELAQIRSQGYSVDNMEHEEGVLCIARPIRGHTGEVIAAVSITTTSLRFQMEELMAHLPALARTTDEISRDLGYVKPA